MPIMVHHFFITDPILIAIRICPQWMLDFLCDPYSEPTPEDKKRTQDMVAEWQANGKFVLHWGLSTYYINKDLVSS